MCTPLSHAGAAFFVPTIIKGGELVVLTKFDPAEVLRVIEEQKITATMLVPSMIYALMDHPDSHTRDLSSLETVYYGASAMNPVRLAEAIRRFGPIFAQYYGQSEAPMVITYLAKGDHDEKRLTSCGRPTLFARTALLGEDGKPVPQGEVGEICVSGPLLSGGYWNLPEETRRDVPRRLDAHRRPGPRGRGRLLVHRRPDQGHDRHRRLQRVPARGGRRCGRTSFGRAGVRDRHPGREVGRGGDGGGGAAARRAVRRGAVATMTAEIQAAVKERKGSVQSPKQVIVVDSVPVTALGKPDKKAVRAQFWEGAGRAVG